MATPPPNDDAPQDTWKQFYDEAVYLQQMADRQTTISDIQYGVRNRPDLVFLSCPAETGLTVTARVTRLPEESSYHGVSLLAFEPYLWDCGPLIAGRPPVDSESSSWESWCAGVDALIKEVRDAPAE